MLFFSNNNANTSAKAIVKDLIKLNIRKNKEINKFFLLVQIGVASNLADIYI